jgi:O-antigen/teichoic acid export membrane protein
VNFRRWVVFTFLIHVLVVVVDKGGGLILYLLTANAPAEHGRSGVAASLPFILGAIANLGLATALVYFVRRGRFTPQVCFETAMAVALGWGTIVAAAAFAVTMWVVPLFDADWHVEWFGLLPICAAVPFLLVASYANSTQLATERIKDYGYVHVATSVAFLPAFFIAFYAFGGNVEKGHVPLGVAWGRLASTILVAALALWLVRKIVTVRMRVHREFLGEALRYGWKANVVSTLTYLNHRIDLIVLGMVVYWTMRREGFENRAAEDLAGEQIAYYSMAVTWAELVWHFPEAMRDLFFSKVAGSSHEQARLLTPVLSRLGLLISLLGAVAIVLVIDPVMSAITWVARGDDAIWLTGWSESVCACLWLLVPGTVGFTVSKVLQADLAARNRLEVCMHAQLLVLVTMLGLDVWLIPAEGARGAALASTVAYVVGSLYTLHVYARETRTSWLSCLVVHPSDFRYIREILVAVVAKLRKRR